MKTITITIKLDGHRIVSASCPGSKFKVGDIVEIIANSIYARDESIGLQGIVVKGGHSVSVKFPIKFGGLYDEWDYLESDLKLIRKAQ